MDNCSDPPCEFTPNLIDFCLGKLDEEGIEEVSHHLEGCPECSAKIKRLDRLSIPFLTRLREAPGDPDTDFLREREYVEAMRRVQGLIDAADETTTSESKDPVA